MPSIEIEDDVFESLKNIAEPFIDTPNTVIKRLLEERMNFIQNNNHHFDHTVITNADMEHDDSDQSCVKISFPFKTNRSFFNQSNHPITIRKEFHEKLKSGGFFRGILSTKDKIPVSITNVVGKEYQGEIYHAKSGWGYYYQILIPGKNAQHYCEGLKMGDVIEVTLSKVNHKVTIILTK